MGDYSFRPAPDGPQETKGLLISGTTQGNVGCAILERHTALKRKLLLAAVVYERTEYRVLATHHCKLPKKRFVGSGDIRKLNQIAARQKIKLVVIPAKATRVQWDAARKACHD